MKGLGIVLIVGGVLLLGAPVLVIPFQDGNGKGGIQLEARAENGEALSLFPLLGIVALATGGALVVASLITKKR